jgi:hypothetical protein
MKARRAQGATDLVELLKKAGSVISVVYPIESFRITWRTAHYQLGDPNG